MNCKDILVAAYLTGTRIDSAVDKCLQQDPNNELCVLLAAVKKASLSGTFESDLLNKIKEFDVTHYSVEEQLIYLICLFDLFLLVGRLNDAYTTLSRVKKILNSQLPDEWKILPIHMNSLLLLSEGNTHAALKLMEICLQKLSVKSSRYTLILWYYLEQLCFSFQKEKFEYYIQEYEKLATTEDLESKLAYIQLHIDLEYGFLENIPKYLEIVEKNSIGYRQMNVVRARGLYEVLTSGKDDFLTDEKPYTWQLRSFAALLQNRPQDALHWARLCSQDRIDNHKLFASFLAYYFIRADLANGNLLSVEHSLLRRKKIDNAGFIDDFFWFRIYHMHKKYDIARKYALKVQKKIEEYKIGERIKLEIRLSPELTQEIFESYLDISANKKVSEADTSIRPASAVKNEDWLIGSSAAITEIKTKIAKLSSIHSNFLILGETGTGKELAAKALHGAGIYRERSFIAINCGAISYSLLQSELFGHVKGAFTGAYDDRVGIFEQAEDGDVFLDEIGEVSPAMQVNLLRLLESGEYIRVGDHTVRKIRCRVIAATNRNLPKMVEEGLYRKDLFYRLEKCVIELPSLRSRKEDIAELCDYFLNKLNPELPPLALSAEVLNYFKGLSWEGNVRELRNEMEYIRLFCSDKKTITMGDLSDKHQNR